MLWCNVISSSKKLDLKMMPSLHLQFEFITTSKSDIFCVGLYATHTSLSYSEQRDLVAFSFFSYYHEMRHVLHHLWYQLMWTAFVLSRGYLVEYFIRHLNHVIYNVRRKIREIDFCIIHYWFSIEGWLTLY